MASTASAELSRTVWYMHGGRSMNSPESQLMRSHIESNDITGIFSVGLHETVVDMGGITQTLPTAVVAALRPDLIPG